MAEEKILATSSKRGSQYPEIPSIFIDVTIVVLLPRHEPCFIMPASKVNSSRSLIFIGIPYKFTPAREELFAPALVR